MECVSSIPRNGLRLQSVIGSLKKAPSQDKLSRILQSFNTWAFKREQPSDPLLLSRFVTQAVMRQEPLSFVLYWGKGPRTELDCPDIECLDYLASLVSRVKAVYPHGARISLIMTDTHATLNGHSAANIARYFTEVEREARARDFECYLLGELTESAGNFVEVENGQMPSEDTLRRLANSAMRWYRGEGTAEEGAKKYYRMNMLEREVVQIFFPSSIFVTFNGRDCRDLFPRKMPIFYMYSLRRGTSVKPWFLPPPADEIEKIAV